MLNTSKEYSLVKFEQRGRVGIIYLNRAPVNALCDDLVSQIIDCAIHASVDPSIGALVLTSGLPKGFSGGADLKEMMDNN